MRDYEKVWHLLLEPGKKNHVITDLVYIKDRPHLVLKWSEGSDGVERPAISVEIDPLRLKILNWPNARYSYDPIEIPQTIDEIMS